MGCGEGFLVEALSKNVRLPGSSPAPLPPQAERTMSACTRLPGRQGQAGHRLAPLQLCHPYPTQGKYSYQPCSPNRPCFHTLYLLPQWGQWGGGSHHIVPAVALHSEVWAEEQVSDGQKQGLSQRASSLIIFFTLLEKDAGRSVEVRQGEVAPGLGLRM